MPELIKSSKVKTITRVNDFMIKFANVNGSGSASANKLFAKSVFRMGIPVSRTIFFRRIFKVCPPGMKSALATPVTWDVVKALTLWWP